MTRGVLVDEDKELLRKFLMSEDISQVNRLEMFQFRGCPAFLSDQLEQPHIKTNYLQINTADDLTQVRFKPVTPKDKLTATQANSIAVDLGKMQKPVTLFVPHTRNSSSINSFNQIVKVIEDLALFYESVKAQQVEQYKMLQRMQKAGATNSYAQGHLSPALGAMNQSGENLRGLLSRMGVPTQASFEAANSENTSKPAEESPQ